MDRLFVYGTLGPGRPNEHIMKKIEGRWLKASVRGQLYPEGWGATLGYPALVLSDDGDEIEGHLFLSDQLAGFWDYLDDFEGDGYQRRLVTVRCEDGSDVEAYVYALKT